MTPPLDIADHLEPFVDWHLVERLEGQARLVLHQPQRRNIALQADQPWEGNFSGSYNTVFRDDEGFRMYYKAGRIPLEGAKGGEMGVLERREMRVCYAQSDDGIHWRKPSLGLYEYRGSKDNNIVWVGHGPDQQGVHGFAPFKDPRPGCPGESRYKAVGAIERATFGDLYAMQSPDGLHWSLMQPEPILKQGVHGKFDSQNVAFWDARLGQYRLYFRDYIGGGPGHGGVRGIKTATSPDFLNWSGLRWVTFPGAELQQLYTNAVQPYFRAPHLLLGMPARYIERSWSPSIEALPELAFRRQRAALLERLGTGLTEPLLMASRDGHTFHRFAEAFLRPGPQSKGNWAYGNNYIAWGMIPTPAELEDAPAELSLFASEGYWQEPGSRIRRLSLRQDGFASIQAPAAGGRLLTPPLRFDGDRLSLNFASSAAGGLRVAILDESSQPIQGYGLDDCDPVLGDELRRIVTWGGRAEVSHVADRPVRLLFELQDADLFALRFERAEKA